MAPVQRPPDSFPPACDQLRARIAELEAALTQAEAQLVKTQAVIADAMIMAQAVDDPEWLAARLAKLTVDKPDLHELARYIASSLRNAR